MRLNIGERLLHATLDRWQPQSTEESATKELPALQLAALQDVIVSIREGNMPQIKFRADMLPAEPPQNTPRWVLDCLLRRQVSK